MADHCCSNDGPFEVRNFLKSKTFLYSSVFLLTWFVSGWADFLEPFHMSLSVYISKIWWTVGLGILIGGLIDRLIPKAVISQHLSGARKRTVLNAVLFGALMSVCSHGVLAIAMQIYKKGASTAAVVTFLMAAPWLNLPLIFLMLGLFGVKTFYIIIGALIVSLWSGYLFQIFESKRWIEGSLAVGPDAGGGEDLRDWKKKISVVSLLSQPVRKLKLYFQSCLDLSEMIVFWILFGLLAAAATSAYIPHEWMEQYLGSGIRGMLTTLGLATVVEVCSEGTSPVAFELYQKTGCLGNAFIFLMAGVATDYTEIGLLWRNIGKKCAILLPVVSVPLILVLAFAANRWL